MARRIREVDLAGNDRATLDAIHVERRRHDLEACISQRDFLARCRARGIEVDPRGGSSVEAGESPVDFAHAHTAGSMLYFVPRVPGTGFEPVHTFV